MAGVRHDRPDTLARSVAWMVFPVVLLAALLWAVEPLTVASASMSPTLQPGDHVIVDKLTGRWRRPAVGDLVVLREPTQDDLVVKRVVALGGQTVALEDGVLVVDGAPQHEPQVDLTRVDSTYFGPVSVPSGAVFVMGDNRGESIDSRTFGSIRTAALVGRVVLTL